MTVTNKDRAEWAAAALRHFQCATGTDYHDAPTDLLCDLHHWCDRENLNFQATLDLARQHYDAECSGDESSKDSTIPYMATFNTPAGWVTEIFHSTSPQAALSAALKYNEGPSFSAEDLEPVAEGYCVREIVITDEHGQQHAVWQTDEYRLQFAAPKLLEALEKQIEITREIIDAWNNTDQLSGAVEDLIDDLRCRSSLAQHVLDAWESSDLTASINQLEESLDAALETIAQAKGGAA